MKKLFTVLLTSFLLIPGLLLEGQVITTISEDFEDGLVSERWQPEHEDSIYTLTNVDDAAGKVLKIDVDKNADNNEGFGAIRYTMESPSVLDISANPYVSVRVKANADVPLQFNLWTETDGNINETAIVYDIVGNEEWVDLIFDFSSVLDETMDATTVVTILMNFNPGWQKFYTGIVWFDDFKVGEAAAPAAGTYFADYYNYDEVNTDIYKPDENGSHVFSIDGNSLKVAVNKVDIWDGFVVEFPEPLDMSNNPLASMKIKTDQNIIFRIYLWDVDSLYGKSDISYEISASAGFHTYYFNWQGKFWHGEWNTPPDDYVPLDSTQIQLFLVNIMPGTAGDFGNVWIDDFRVGSIAEIQTASNDKDILSTSIGVISGNALKNVPGGTTAGTLLAGLTLSDKATAKVLSSSGGSVAAAAAVLTNDFVVEVTAENGTKKEYTIELLVIPPDALRIFKLPGTVDDPTFLDVEDGQIDDIWAEYPATEMTNMVIDLDDLGATYDGPSDISGTFKTAWNEYSLYILAEITDDILINNSTNTYTDDAVEVFLDMTNKKNDVSTGYGTDDYQILFGYNETNAEVFIGGGATGHVYGWEQGLAAGGYWMEIEFDIEELFSPTGLTPEIGRVIGMDIQVDEDDGNFDNDGDGTHREHILLWNAEANENWHDPSGFGTAVLAGDVTGIEKIEKYATKFTAYPNPANGQITLLNTENIHLVEIYSLTGQKLITIKGEFAQETVLNVSELSAGAYILKLIEKDGNTSAVKFIKE